MLCLFLLLFVLFPISFSTSFLLFVAYHFYLSLFSVMSLLRFVPCSLPLPRTFSFSSPPHSVLFHCSSISSSIFRSSRCFVVFSLFTSSRSSRLFRYLRLSSICQIPFLASRGRAFTRANGNILFTPFSLSSLNFAARLSVRFLFLFSLRSHEPFEVSNENRRSKLFLSFSFIFGFSRSFSFFF